MPSNSENIKVLDVLKSRFAVSTEDGEALFSLIDANFKKGKSVNLDFKDIYLIVSTFLNAAIGQLYSDYKSDFLKEHLNIHNLSDDDLPVLAKVIERAKEYFTDKNSVENFLKKNLNHGE